MATALIWRGCSAPGQPGPALQPYGESRDSGPRARPRRGICPWQECGGRGRKRGGARPDRHPAAAVPTGSCRVFGQVGVIHPRLTVIRKFHAMPHYLRPHVTGASIFFTVALADRKSRLLVEEIDLLRASVRATRAERPFGIDAWVVLPDHLHCVWTLPAGDADYPTRWRLIKARFSRELPPAGLRESHVRRQERGVWQRRFWEHHLRDYADYAAHVRYCWINPVKHGLVERPEDWPYSSIHRDGGFG